MTDYPSSAHKIGALLKEQMVKDPHFYLFSPDETTSNRADAVFDVAERAWNAPVKDWDLPSNSKGRIVEMLSENTIFSVMTGHLMNGEQAMMTSYEAFFPIITAQLLQQIKFYNQSNKVKWRPKYPAVNLLSTSTCWRQDHNGFTHQSPALISTLLNLPSRICNCFFPVDIVASEAVFDYMLRTRNTVNLTTFNKTTEPQWLTRTQAREQLRSGVQVFKKISDKNPDIVFAAAGDIMTRETIAAMEILRADLPQLKMRFVNILALSFSALGTVEHPLPPEQFDEIFLERCPIVANFHGYPEALNSIFAHYTDPKRISVHGFTDQGSTTTPFEMLTKNHASRYDLCIDVAQQLQRKDLVEKYQKLIVENHHYALQHDVDKIAL